MGKNILLNNIFFFKKKRISVLQHTDPNSHVTAFLVL